jgi:CTP:phosphocholine cytidylyltransferase-like protein
MNFPYHKDKYDISPVSFTSFSLKKEEHLIISSIHKLLDKLIITYTFNPEKLLWDGTWNKQVFTIDLYYDKVKDETIVDLCCVKKKTDVFWKLFKELKKVAI